VVEAAAVQLPQQVDAEVEAAAEVVRQRLKRLRPSTIRIARQVEEPAPMPTSRKVDRSSFRQLH
jgi:hypothetical protein